jgi:hypothetical protein
MSLYNTVIGQGDFRTVYSNVLTTRPTAAFGTSIAPGNNTMGTATALTLTATQACYAILVNINSGATSTAVRNMLVDIMYDAAGGTSYTTNLLPYLIGGCASPYNIFSGGIWYYFPIYIPSGATLAARAQVNNATVGTVRVAAWIFADPMHPAMMKYGQRCEAIGTVAASSQGTTITTVGTTSEGTWQSLGASTNQNFWWQCGMSINNGTITALMHHMDIAADNNALPKMLIQDILVNSSSTEQVSFACDGIAQNTGTIAAGTTIYGRAQCSGTVITGISMIAYGVS